MPKIPKTTDTELNTALIFDGSVFQINIKDWLESESKQLLHGEIRLQLTNADGVRFDFGSKEHIDALSGLTSITLKQVITAGTYSYLLQLRDNSSDIHDIESGQIQYI